MTSGDLAKLDREIKRLVTVAASLGEDEKPEELAANSKDRTHRRCELRARLETERTAPRAIDLEVRRLEVEARKRVSNLRTMLSRTVAEGRRMVDSLIEESIRFVPIATDDGPRYRLEARTAAGGLFRIEGVPDGI